MKIKTLCASVLLLAASCAFADSVLDSSLKAQKVTGAASHEVLVAAESIKPGEVLQYSLDYQNKSNTSLKKVEFVLPIPKDTEYMPSSGMTALEQASLDGKTFEKAPLKRKVKTPQGKEVLQDVPPTEYRFLKWTKADMPAGEKLSFHARVKATQ